MSIKLETVLFTTSRRKTSYMTSTMPESSIEFLRHSVGGVTYRHYALRDPLAFRAIMTLPQPTACNGLIHGTTVNVRVVEESLLKRRPVGRMWHP
ncbi:MAG: hypothetical protein AAF483_03765 [Planctomycetota bacterium]